MNLALHAFAATAALLAVPVVQETTGPEPATFVIRYDPASIHLTDSLVEPLLRRDGVVAPSEIEGAPEIEGPILLSLIATSGNEKQPPGVYIARAQAYVEGEMASDPILTPAVRDLAVDRGLEQLREALHERLYNKRFQRMLDRLNMLSATEGKTQDKLRKVSELLAIQELGLQTSAELRAAQGEKERLAMELTEAERRLMASVRALEGAQTKLDTQSTEIESAVNLLEATLNKLVEVGQITTLERTEQLDRKRAEAATRIAGVTARVDQLNSDVILAEQTMKVARSRGDGAAANILRLQAELEQLGGRAGDVKAAVRTAELSLERDVLIAQARDLARERQELETQLSMLHQVTVERW